MSAIPSYKDIVDLLKKGATLEAQERIMELREAAISLQDENHSLQERVKQLEEALRFKDGLRFAAPFYFKEGDEYPFCPRCWEKDKRGIHLSPETAKGYIYIRTCPDCKAEYHTRDMEF
jgi:hypothetical protein